MKFEENGSLAPGIHQIDAKNFVAEFCETSKQRQDYLKAVTDLFDFAVAKGARYIFVGGSFCSNKENPNDLDAVIVFPDESHVPQLKESVLVADKNLDILVCAETDKRTVDSFIDLLSHDRNGFQVGILQINLNGSHGQWRVTHELDDDQREVIRKAYAHRAITNTNKKAGVLITIHGILTHAEWNFEMTPLANEQDWIVAPFYYGKVSPAVLFCDSKRRKIKEKFRNWVYDIHMNYGSRFPISIVAHSFGTWLVGSYFEGFKSSKVPVSIQSIILTGSILKEDFDWGVHRNSIGIVRNEIGLSDFWVSKMPTFSYPGKDSLFGRAGVNGFSKESDILVQDKTEILDHNNVFRKDIIHSRWLPFLHANRKRLENRLMSEMIKGIQKRPPTV